MSTAFLTCELEKNLFPFSKKKIIIMSYFTIYCKTAWDLIRVPCSEFRKNSKCNTFSTQQMFKKLNLLTGEWKQGKRDGYGRQETYTQCNIDNDMMLITIHDGCWKEDKFHGSDSDGVGLKT